MGRLNEWLGRKNLDEIDYDDYERDRLDDTPTQVMTDEEMRYYWYIRLSNLTGGKKPTME